MPLETKLKVAGQGGDQCFQKQKRPKASLRPCDGVERCLLLGGAGGTGGASRLAIRAAFHATGRGGILGGAAFLGGATSHQGGSANDQGEEFDGFHSLLFYFLRPLAPGLLKDDSVPQGLADRGSLAAIFKKSTT